MQLLAAFLFLLSCFGVDKHNGHIIDIRAGRPGDQQTIACCKPMIGIVSAQYVRNADPLLLQSAGTVSVYIASRSVGRTVCAIRTD